MKKERRIVESHSESNMEFYEEEADNFGAMSNREDPKRLLRKFLLSRFDWQDKTVLEAGAGEGRITDYYISKVKSAQLTDISSEMVRKLEHKYSKWDNIQVSQCGHSELRHRFTSHWDVFLCAFSLAYAYPAARISFDEYRHKLDLVFPEDVPLRIVIECCGIFEKYDHMGPEWKRYIEVLSDRFQYHEIRTEFAFDRWQDAYATAKILFPGVAEKIKETQCSTIPEIIGVFYDGETGDG